MPLDTRGLCNWMRHGVCFSWRSDFVFELPHYRTVSHTSKYRRGRFLANSESRSGIALVATFVWTYLMGLCCNTQPGPRNAVMRERSWASDKASPGCSAPTQPQLYLPLSWTRVRLRQPTSGMVEVGASSPVFAGFAGGVEGEN